MKMLKLLRADSLEPVFAVANIFAGKKGKSNFCKTFKIAVPLWLPVLPTPKPKSYLLAWKETQAIISVLKMWRKSQGT